MGGQLGVAQNEIGAFSLREVAHILDAHHIEGRAHQHPGHQSAPGFLADGSRRSGNGQQAEADQVAEEDATATGEPTATAGDSDDSSSDDGGSDNKTILLIVVAGLAIGTIAGIIVRGRHKE